MDFKEALKKALGEDMRASPSLCQEVWSALANIVWVHEDAEQGDYSCSFRYAGRLISDILGKGDYMDWYCCGPYETVTYKIRKAMSEEGWSPYRYVPNKGVIDEEAPIDPCCDCGNDSDWVYLPAFEGDSNPYFCDECVPRGCSCNHEYIHCNGGDYGSEPTEEDAPWIWVDKGKSIWTHVDELGREFPCVEYNPTKTGD